MARRRVHIHNAFDRETLFGSPEEWCATNYSIMEMTPAAEAKVIANRIAQCLRGEQSGTSITGLECSAGVGGNTAAFMREGFKMIAIESDKVTYECLVANTNLVAELDKSVSRPTIIAADIAEAFAEQAKQVDFIFADPPWGGSKTRKMRDLRLKYTNSSSESADLDVRALIRQAAELPNIRLFVLKAPMNVSPAYYDVHQLGFEHIGWMMFVNENGRASYQLVFYSQAPFPTNALQPERREYIDYRSIRYTDYYDDNDRERSEQATSHKDYYDDNEQATSHEDNDREPRDESGDKHAGDALSETAAWQSSEGPDSFLPIDWYTPITTEEFKRRVTMVVDFVTKYPIIGQRYSSAAYHIDEKLSVEEAIICAASIRMAGSAYSIICSIENPIVNILCNSRVLPGDCKRVFRIIKPCVILRNLDYTFRAPNPNTAETYDFIIDARYGGRFRTISNMLATRLYRNAELNYLCVARDGQSFAEVCRKTFGSAYDLQTRGRQPCILCQGPHYLFDRHGIIDCPKIRDREIPAALQARGSMIRRPATDQNADNEQSMEPMEIRAEHSYFRARYAYVTLLMVDDKYMPGCLTLAHALRRHGTHADLVCMVTDEVSDEAKKDLAQIYDRVVEVERVITEGRSLRDIYERICNEYTDPRRQIREFHEKLKKKYSWINQSCTKWECLKLVDYEKVMFIDADMLPMRNIDNLFELNVPAGIISNVNSKFSYDMPTISFGPTFATTPHGEYVARSVMATAMLSITATPGAALIILQPDLEKYKFFREVAQGNVQAQEMAAEQVTKHSLGSIGRRICEAYLPGDGIIGSLQSYNGTDEQVIALVEYLWGSQWTAVSLPYAGSSWWMEQIVNERRNSNLKFDEVAVMDYMIGKPWDNNTRHYSDVTVWWVEARAAVQGKPEWAKWYNAEYLANISIDLQDSPALNTCTYCKMLTPFLTLYDCPWRDTNHRIYTVDGELSCPYLLEAARIYAPDALDRHGAGAGPASNSSDTSLTKIITHIDAKLGAQSSETTPDESMSNQIITTSDLTSEKSSFVYFEPNITLFPSYDYYTAISQEEFAMFMKERFFAQSNRVRQEKDTRFAWVVDLARWNLPLAMIVGFTMQLTNTKYPVILKPDHSMHADQLALLATVYDQILITTDDHVHIKITEPMIFLRNVDCCFELHGAAQHDFLQSAGLAYNEENRAGFEMLLGLMLRSAELNIMFHGFRAVAERIIGRRGLRYEPGPCLVCREIDHSTFTKTLETRCPTIHRALENNVAAHKILADSDKKKRHLFIDEAKKTSKSNKTKSHKESRAKPPKKHAPDEKHRQRFAFVTLLMVDDKYMPGCLTLAHAFRRYKTTADLVCMVTDEVSDEAKKDLAQIYDRVIEVDKIVAEFASTDAHYVEISADVERRPHYLSMIPRLTSRYTWMGQSCTKWECLKFVEYEKIIFIDADMLPLGNIDHLFELAAPAGVFGQMSYREMLYSYGRKHLVKPHGTKLSREECFDRFCTTGFVCIAALILVEPNKEKHARLLKMLDVDREMVKECIEAHGLDPRILDTYFTEHFGNRVCLSGSDEQAIAVLEYLGGAQWTAIDSDYLFRLSKVDLSLSDKRQAYGQHPRLSFMAREGAARIFDFMIGKPWREAPDEYLDYLIWWAEALSTAGDYPHFAHYYDEEKCVVARETLNGRNRPEQMSTCDYCRLINAQAAMYDWAARDVNHAPLAWDNEHNDYQIVCPALCSEDLVAKLSSNGPEEILGGAESVTSLVPYRQPRQTKPENHKKLMTQPRDMPMEFGVQSVMQGLELIAIILAACVALLVWVIANMCTYTSRCAMAPMRPMPMSKPIGKH